MRGCLRQLLRDEGGASAIDYSLVVALISVLVIGAVTAIGDDVSNLFRAIVTAVAGTGKV
ncbi:MAG TPA: Flp family type IVb pilin [Stellaceae bacterium]